MTEIKKIECPFCNKIGVPVLHQIPTLQTATSHAAGKTKTKYYYTKEKYEVQTPCHNCGKSAKEIQKALDEGKRDPEKERKILERLKKQGLDMSFETKF